MQEREGKAQSNRDTQVMEMRMLKSTLSLSISERQGTTTTSSKNDLFPVSWYFREAK